ncbi:MAG: exo-alpha-sialidase [Candidatus Dormibacteraeota bacterium]|nr:exo-alpha-sialidase [Candidatus Dormibacteraeota bacterium]
MAIDPNDPSNLFTGTPWGFSTTVSLLWKSQDGGVQWNNLHGAAAGDTPPCPDAAAVVLRPDCSRGGGDAEVQLSQPAGSGDPSRVQFEDLNGLDSISCAYSDNGGDTFNDLTTPTDHTGSPQAGAACNEGGTANATNCAQETTNPSAGCATLGTDRQWLQIWPKADQPTTGTCSPAAAACGASDEGYMTFDTGDQPPSGDAAIYSADNGQDWGLSCSTTTGSSCVGGSNGVGARPGPLVINPTLLQTVNGVTYPTLYEFMGTNSNGTEVNISCDGGQTWTNVATSNGLAGSTTNDFVVGAMDQSGELYTAFTVANDPNPWRVWFNHSLPAKAKAVGNCSSPVQAVWGTATALTGPASSADGVATTPIPGETYAVMPWLAAGSGGRVDLVYYGTTAPIGLQPDSQASTWYLHMAQSLDGGGTWADQQATETPMHLESICFSGLGCTAQQPPGGDRNLLDFFQVKIDQNGRADIIFTDDANSAACTNVTCTQGIGLISEVQQATGPSLLANPGTVPGLPSTGLGQSLDTRSAGVNAEIKRNEQGNTFLASPGHNISGTYVPAADITDFKVCLVNSSVCPVANTASGTVAFLFTLRSLSGGPQAAVQTASGQLNANWLATWRGGSPNDLWFAQASSSATGAMTCIYGRPTSIFNDGEPKAAEYISGTGTGNANCSVNATTSVVNGQAPNTIEIDVPMNATSGLSPSSELYGLTGWTGNSTTALDGTVCSADGLNPTMNNCSGSVGFFNNIAQTAPMDVVFASSTNTPEAPAAVLLLGVGGLLAAAGAAVRRRRARGLPS